MANPPPSRGERTSRSGGNANGPAPAAVREPLAATKATPSATHKTAGSSIAVARRGPRCWAGGGCRARRSQRPASPWIRIGGLAAAPWAEHSAFLVAARRRAERARLTACNSDFAAARIPNLDATRWELPVGGRSTKRPQFALWCLGQRCPKRWRRSGRESRCARTVLNHNHTTQCVGGKLS